MLPLILRDTETVPLNMCFSALGLNQKRGREPSVFTRSVCRFSLSGISSIFPLYDSKSHVMHQMVTVCPRRPKEEQWLWLPLTAI
jgi:hypothetical protein